MKNNISLLYKYLMGKLMHQNQGWYGAYKSLTDRVSNLQKRIGTNHDLDLNSQALYEGLEFEDKEDFLKELFANKGNGIASNGQSNLGEKDFLDIRSDDSFLDALKNLVFEPSKLNHNSFASVWNEKIGKNNRVQINRAAAACNLQLSSTVEEGKFGQVFNWLLKFKYIPDYQGEKNWYDQNIFLTNYIKQELETTNDDKLPEHDPYWINIFIWLIYENISNPFSLKKQVVKYGAPGTGKTYLAKETAKLQFDIWNHAFGSDSKLTFDDSHIFIQFHPSYTYEDFMEGLRPVPDGKGQVQLKITNGVFKQHCINAGIWECDLYKLGIREVDVLTIGALKEYESRLTGNHWKSIFTLPEELKLTEALPPFFVLIDEINRAELSRVFGELMYCLEYRGLHGVIKTQYAQLNTEETGMLKVADGYQFFIPSNLYIIASMNTVDRSVDSFDFALRRRFKWEEVKPDMSLLKYHLTSKYLKWQSLANSLEALNDRILKEPILGKDYCIGHAYLWTLNYSPETSLTEIKKLIWDDSIGALIEEYLRGSGKEDLYKDLQTTFTK